MKKSLLILLAVLFTGSMFAQIRPAAPTNGGARALPPPLPVRQISGIVKDTTDATVPGAVVKLKSKDGLDSAITSTNGDGIFVFKNIKPFEFTIIATSLGYRPFAQKYKMNDAAARLTLDPIVLKSASTALKEVVVNGTPSIVYKVDTMEYKASDYKVRPNATLDELLKKMEGFEVGSDGSVTHQGQAVTKLNLNGKAYLGGNVAQAIQNLPAEILEKVQVVDDYGEQAARSGIKDGDPTKTLNVTTKADRSVGTTGRLIARAGNHDRYDVNLNATRINANQTIAMIASYQNTVLGVPSSGQGGGGGNSPGVAEVLRPTVSYRDQFGPKVQMNSSVSYNFNNRSTVNQSYGTNASTVIQKGTFTTNNTNQSNQNGRSANVQFDFALDSLNFLQINPNYNYSTQEQTTTQDNDRFTRYFPRPGLVNPIEHVTTTGTTTSKSPNSTFEIQSLFNHRFRKPGRNFSLNFDYQHRDVESNGEVNNRYQYFADSTLTTRIKDSLQHTYTRRSNLTNQVDARANYSEPLSTTTRITFEAEVNSQSHNTDNTVDDILADGTTKRRDDQSVIYDYTTTESKFSTSYRYQGTKTQFALGVTFSPYYLGGHKVNNKVGAAVATSRTDFRVLPVIQYTYAWSRTQRFNLRYSGNTSEPDFQQIQPFEDRSNGTTITRGNPNLKATLNNSISMGYNNYFPNSRFNISINTNASYTTNQSTTNRIDSLATITSGGKTSSQNYRIINYVNLSGSKSVGGNYNISKQLADRRYNLALNGRVQYGYDLSMSNNILTHDTRWELNERFGPRISPSDNVEINPFISTDLTRSFSTISENTWSRKTENQLGIDGRFYFFKTYQVHYDAHKSLITQTASTNGIIVPTSTNSPLVINAGFQKEIGQKRSFTITFDMYDLLHQNKYLDQTFVNGGVTNTLTTSLSQYFMIGFRLNLQKWSGRPQRNGRDMQRRGDGSFIYN